MKLTLNKKGKVVVIPKKSKRQKTKRKLTPYEKYVIRAKELNVYPILKEGAYNSTIKLHREKGRKVNPEIIARWQAQGKKTDKQIKSKWNAAKLQNPNITRAQFIRERGWETIDQQAEDLYEKIKSTKEYQEIEAEIEELENKKLDWKLDLIESRRLNRLKEQKSMMLHQISQQIYGSE